MELDASKMLYSAVSLVLKDEGSTISTSLSKTAVKWNGVQTTKQLGMALLRSF